MDGRLHERRGCSRLRAAGAGPDHQSVFTDRVIATPVVLRFQLPHGARREYFDETYAAVAILISDRSAER